MRRRGGGAGLRAVGGAVGRGFPTQVRTAHHQPRLLRERPSVVSVVKFCFCFCFFREDKFSKNLVFFESAKSGGDWRVLRVQPRTGTPVARMAV